MSRPRPNQVPPRPPRLRFRHLVWATLVGAVVGIVLYRRAKLEASARRFHAEYDAA